MVAQHLSSPQFSQLIQKHWRILKDVKFALSSGVQTFAQATSDTSHQGVLDPNGYPINTPHYTFVDDNHMAHIRSRMLSAMAASMEAIFLVLGKDPKLPTRRSALSLDKFYHAVCSWEKIQLGNLVKTRTMTVSSAPEKLEHISTTLQH